MITTTRVPSIEAITTGLPLPTLEGVKPTTAKRIDAHNAAVDGLHSYIASLSTAVDAAVKAVGDDDTDLLALGTAVENRRFAKADSYSRACRLWRERHEIAETMVEDLSPAVTAAEAAHAKAVEKAIDLLAKAGLTTDEMPAAQVNERTARTQLDGVVRQCRPVRTTAAEITNAESRLNAARQHVSTSKSGEATARSAVKAMAERMAASA